jgi:amino acid adenylation domain-containing protein
VAEGLFPPGLIEELLGSYLGLVQQLSDEEGAWQRPASAWLSQHQARRHGGWHRPDAPDRLRLLDERVAEQVQHRGDAPAIVSEAGRLTYSALAARAAALQSRLEALGIGREDRVGLALPAGPDAVVGILGALRAGAAYVPVDPDWPAARRQRIWARSGVRVVVSVRCGGQTESGSPGLTVLALEEVTPTAPPAVAAAAAAAPGRMPADLAYIIFTSGTTGEPKGVAIEHGSADNTLAAVNGRFGLGPADAVLAVSALSFDLSVFDILGLLAAGGRVVFPPGAPGRPDPKGWADCLEGEGVTVWNSVPALLELLVDYCEHAGRGAALRGLRLVLLSGDWIPLSLIGRLRRLAGPDLEVISLGGATEGSIWSVWYRVGAIEPAWRSIPYGRPLPNQRVYVLNGAGQECGAWARGELYLGGLGVARGYWGDEEQTRERFVRAGPSGERLYRTGDLGRYWPDGTIELLGRADRQVKLQGYRVELGEVEAALQQGPGVRDAVVTVAGDRPGAKRLRAWVVGESAAAGDSAALRRHLAERLPGYMLPATIEWLPHFPLTPNGKVDRSALSERTFLPNAKFLRCAPETPLERRLASIWADVLALSMDEVSTTDNFFTAGGDSLRAIEMVTRINAVFPIVISLDHLLSAKNLADLASIVEAALVAYVENLGEESAECFLRYT